MAYQGDPETGKPTDGSTHEHHIWPVDRVRDLVANQDEAVTFFCGGSRNFSKRELVVRLYRTKEDIPKNGVVIDATAPIARVVDEIVRRSEAETVS